MSHFGDEAVGMCNPHNINAACRTCVWCILVIDIRYILVLRHALLYIVQRTVYTLHYVNGVDSLAMLSSIFQLTGVSSGWRAGALLGIQQRWRGRLFISLASSLGSM